MITVEEARQIVAQHSVPLPPASIPLASACGLVLAADVHSLIDMPSFNQSNMDGYAFAFNDWEPGKTLTIQGESAAGNTEQNNLQPGTAMRIFTGAPVPPGADTVVMQEQTEITDGVLQITAPNLSAGTNVRLQATDIRKGEIAMQQGDLLTPGALGFLTGLGLMEVTVYPAPKIAIIVTGKELQQGGNPLSHGQVYESNAITLTTALKQLPVQHIQVASVEDDLEILKAAIDKALAEADIFLLTGGVSVGDYDFVVPALEQCGVEKLFHKVKQKPGKPLFFGKKGQQIVFGLPGNPSSVLSCFYNYVLLSLQHLFNRSEPFLQTLQLPLAKGFSKPAGLTHFLKGRITQQSVWPLTAQESYRLSSFATANCLIEIPEASTSIAAGDTVTVHRLLNA